MELEKLLERNYHRIRDEECKSRVIDYISSQRTVFGDNIFFIKHLTKVAHHIIKSDPESIDNLLERLYQFNMEGIEMISLGEVSITSDSNLKVLESHFSSHAASVAYKVFKKTNNIGWLKRAYSRSIESADLIINESTIHAAHSYQFAGHSASQIHRLTGELDWCKKAFEAYESTSQLFDSKNKKNRLSAIKGAASKAKILHETTNDIYWAEQTYELNIQYTQQITNKYQEAESYRYAGNAAKSLFDKTQNEHWKIEAIRCYSHFLNYYEDNPIEKLDKFASRAKFDLKSLNI